MEFIVLVNNKKNTLKYDDTEIKLNNECVATRGDVIKKIEIVSYKVHLFKSKIFMGYAKYYVKITLSTNVWFMTNDLKNLLLFIQMWENKTQEIDGVNSLPLNSDGENYKIMIDRIKDIGMKAVLSDDIDNYLHKEIVVIDGDNNWITNDILSRDFGYNIIKNLKNFWKNGIHDIKVFGWDGVNPVPMLLCLSIINFLLLTFIPYIGGIIPILFTLYLFFFFENSEVSKSYIYIISGSNILFKQYIKRFALLLGGFLIVNIISAVSSSATYLLNSYYTIISIFAFFIYLIFGLKFRNIEKMTNHSTK